jgi:wyosine [tRNA(Phe)-imidazoG37] synthetase (radical SAM superfamily)
MVIHPKKCVVYGPVRSRRLGASLGINVLPSGSKRCTFDCLYCQYGWTAPASDELPFPSVEEVLEGVEESLARLVHPPDYITFSGNGEPTLHTGFSALVDGVNRVRDRRAPSAKTAVLSNSTRASDPATREALGRLDARIMKLDAGTEETFRRLNRPVEAISLGAIVEGLRALPGVTLQSLFVAGPAGNAAPAEIEAWAARVESIAPVGVQIYTLERGWPSELIEPLGEERLEAIRDYLASRGIAAEVFPSRA